jgi:hypothetical protein
MPTYRAPSPSSVLAIVLAAAVTMIAMAGCSHITPLGTDAGPSMPPPSHLGSPIIVQVMRSQNHPAISGCPAGWLEVFLPASMLPHSSSSVRLAPAPGQPGAPVPAGTPSTSQPPPNIAPSPLPCYHPVGTPVEITFAAISSVVAYPVPPNQPKGPAPYGFTIAVPTADVGAVTALITQAYDSHAALGISVAGKLWAAPQVDGRFSGQQLSIAVFTRNQALKLYRLLIPST